ncbi:MAG TPA: hypothetical protein VGW57_14120 [Chthoniobacterales bacterium]|nr:hypothetical protein [Chthoniobacterales bacterium]
MVKKLLGSVIAVILMASVATQAAEPVGFEVRMRNSIGRMGMVNTHPTVKTEADGTMVVSFQAEKEGMYYLIYTSGPKKGKTATSVQVAKPGPVTTKVKK